MEQECTQRWMSCTNPHNSICSREDMVYASAINPTITIKICYRFSDVTTPINKFAAYEMMRKVETFCDASHQPGSQDPVTMSPVAKTLSRCVPRRLDSFSQPFKRRPSSDIMGTRNLIHPRRYERRRVRVLLAVLLDLRPRRTQTKHQTLFVGEII
ncbi:hypothetical protein BCR43DRAFT_251640 [Syncephalastrum racemosum]|uniref:Uncharacterized protein n=1 Tax=Syncephalastrum racemosum TaxID=13706 RepID=A0A1X2HFP5_SYNRA|nr:hypothetical protein BCR43DRAFT_251640 [Syncephalastrum racemosum]